MGVRIKVTGILELEESEGADPNDATGFTQDGYQKWVIDGQASLASLEEFDSEVVS